MLKPPIPSNEFQRLETLRNLKLLDTPPEERFDRVTRLAQRVFAVPIALVSLVDQDRQWFKSRQGLDATETPREISFCGYTILSDRVMVVEDAREDERFCDNPLVSCDPNIRFYAGYPVSAPDGSRIGTLCIIDNKPRKFAQADIKLLVELGRMIEEELIDAAMLTTDPVTGISNRNGFNMVASPLIKACVRMEQPVSLLLFCLDELKAIESKGGYEGGDAIAAETAHFLLANFRESDVIARISVDVFAVLLAGVDLHGATAAESRLHEMLGQRNRQEGVEFEIDLTTAQMAFHRGRHQDVAALLKDAEQHLAERYAEVS